jgi:hypothetical protein
MRSGTQVFAMRLRITTLERRIPATPARSFVLFPLLSGDAESSEYMAAVRKRFPAGKLRSVWRGGREFTMGSAVDLRYLFPGASLTAVPHV